MGDPSGFRMAAFVMISTETSSAANVTANAKQATPMNCSINKKETFCMNGARWRQHQNQKSTHMKMFLKQGTQKRRSVYKCIQIIYIIERTYKQHMHCILFNKNPNTRMSFGPNLYYNLFTKQLNKQIHTHKPCTHSKPFAIHVTRLARKFSF